MARVIDLSVPLTTRAKHLKNVKIEYIDHKTNMKTRGPQLGLKDNDFPEWGYCAVENLSLNSHDGTHLDAPWHYSPMTEGKPSKTIDQIPLEWCYGHGVVLDFHHFERERPIEIKDLEDALQKISYRLEPFDIVLIRTDATKRWLEEGYRDLGAGLTAVSTEWLIDQGIKVMGIDSWTLDQPFDVMLKRGKPERFLESHKLGHNKEYCHMESLANLDKIPRPFGFKVAAFPIKVEGGSGSWTRAVAIVEE
jgi:kynurenine formamidase